MRRWFLLLFLLLLPLAALAAWPNSGQPYPYGTALNSNTNSFISRLATRPSTSNILAYNRVFSWLSYVGTLYKLDGLYLFEAQDQPTANTNLISSSWTIVPSTSPAPTYTAYSGYVGTTSSSPFAALFPKTGSTFFDPSVTTGQLFNAGGSTAGTVFTSKSSTSTYDTANSVGSFGISATCSFQCLIMNSFPSGNGFSLNEFGPYRVTAPVTTILDEGAIFLTRLNGTSTPGTVLYSSGIPVSNSNATGMIVPTSQLEFLNSGAQQAGGGTPGVGSSSTVNAAGMGGGLTQNDVQNLTNAIQNYSYDVRGLKCPSAWDGYAPFGPCLRAGITQLIYPLTFDWHGSIMTRLNDGRLFATVNSGVFICSNPGHQALYYMLSSDNGKTWTPSAPGTLIINGGNYPTTPSKTYWSTGLLTLPNGNILMGVGSTQYSSTDCGSAVETQVQYVMIGTVVPNGPITFGPPIRVTQDNDPIFGAAQPFQGSASASNPLLLPDGKTIMLSLYSYTWNLGVTFSSDGGNTWSSPAVLVQPPTTNHSPNEMNCVIVPSNNNTYCLYRDDGNGLGFDPSNIYQGIYVTQTPTPQISASWTTPIHLYDGTKVNFVSVPAVTVDPSGRMMFLVRGMVNPYAISRDAGTRCQSAVGYSTDGVGATWSVLQAQGCSTTESISQGGAYSYCFYDKGHTNNFMCDWNVGDINSSPTGTFAQQFFFAN